MQPRQLHPETAPPIGRKMLLENRFEDETVKIHLPLIQLIMLL
jgi:hypothetical protein